MQTESIGKLAFFIVVTGDHVGHMLTAPFYRYAIFGIERLAPARHPDTLNGPPRLRRRARHILVSPLLSEQSDLCNIIPVNDR